MDKGGFGYIWLVVATFFFVIAILSFIFGSIEKKEKERTIVDTIQHPINAGSSTDEDLFRIEPEVKQSGTASWNALKILKQCPSTTDTIFGDGSTGYGNNLIELE